MTTEGFGPISADAFIGKTAKISTMPVNNSMSLFFIVHLLTPHYNTPNTQFAKDFLNDKETSSGNTTVACHVLTKKQKSLGIISISRLFVALETATTERKPHKSNYHKLRSY
jgi:hypothetical protein